MSLFEYLDIFIVWAAVRCSLVVVCALHRLVNDQFACLHDFTADDHLIEDLVNLVEVEHEVELAYASKVLVQHFYEQVDEFKHG